ncbi:MAG: hypothetical protein R2861_02745 [Desulfobacterales bacterium]
MLIGFVLLQPCGDQNSHPPVFRHPDLHFDNLGDVCGGALFSFVLIYFATLFQALAAGHLPLVAALFCLYRTTYPDTAWPVPVAGTLVALATLAGAMILEMPSLRPAPATLLLSGDPVWPTSGGSGPGADHHFSERTAGILFPETRARQKQPSITLSPRSDPDQILLISADRQMMRKPLNTKLTALTM